LTPPQEKPAPIHDTPTPWRQCLASYVVAHDRGEIGVDMARFRPPAISCRGGLCPRKRALASAARRACAKGANWLKTTLVTAAWAAVHKHDSYLRAQFLRIKGRRGAKKAILAVAASMLTAAYYMLRDGVAYRDLGGQHFDRRDKTKTIHRLVGD
jgi:hypothetical protein